VGVGSGGGLRRVFPVVQSRIRSYTASDVSVVNVDWFPDFKFDIARWDVNSPWSEERGKFDVIFASNSIHCGRRMRTVLSNISNALNDRLFPPGRMRL
jgi:hypothetical protein